ncbi:MAG: prepilin-type N-terminal cleavage/methylation domain-containing protein [bacterium]|nr:prepilin-type N-terminal cleavage/methylation domain-containing protein [bacterium]
MNNRGFTLIELLIVVAIIGVIAAIAVPSLVNAVNRGRQKRTVADIRTIGHAIEAYAVDYFNYPGMGRLGTGIAGTASDFEAFLCPDYIKRLPSIDGWGGEYQMVTGHYVTSRVPGYVIVSFGRDGVYEGSVPPEGEVVYTTDFDADIVFGNGSFWKRPHGIQVD